MNEPLMGNDVVILKAAIIACVENGFRLLDDADFLGGSTETPTAFALYILAEEEFGKALILHLVEVKILPWTQYIQRALRDHTCKHLMGVLIDFMELTEEEWVAHHEAWSAAYRTGDPFPASKSLTAEVISALNLFRHEKIGRWENRWGYLDDLAFDPSVEALARGSFDSKKQDALYVNIDRNGRLSNKPKPYTQHDDEHEKERAKRFGSFARSLAAESPPMGYEYERLTQLLKEIFSNLNTYVDSGA
jgi:AbiV family abortive infection protein